MSVDVARTAIERRARSRAVDARSGRGPARRPELALGRLLGWIGDRREAPAEVAEAVERPLVSPSRPGDTAGLLPCRDLMVGTGRWRAELLSDDEAAVVDEIAGRRLATLGYDAG